MVCLAQPPTHGSILRGLTVPTTRSISVGNVDIRGYETIDDEGPSSINGTTTINVFNCPSDKFGRPGRLDMQNIALPSAFATQTLTTIELVDNGGYNIQRAILDGVTVGVPEPSTFVLLGSGAVVLAAYPWLMTETTGVAVSGP